jgi:hypothetical protein
VQKVKQETIPPTVSGIDFIDPNIERVKNEVEIFGEVIK